jgi:hypothetical protein
MANSGGEDEDWGEGSGNEEEREEGDDDLMEVEPSESRDSVKGPTNETTPDRGFWGGPTNETNPHITSKTIKKQTHPHPSNQIVDSTTSSTRLSLPS